MKLFIVFYCFITVLFANSISIEERYFIDKTNTFTLEDVLLKSDSFIPMDRYNFGVSTHPFWIELTFENKTDTPITQRVYNKRAGLDFVDVYIFQNNAVVKNYTLGDMRDHSIRDNIFRISYFDMEFEPHQKVKIYIKQQSYGTMETEWQLADIGYFNSCANYQSMAYFLIIGILVVATIASFMFYFLLKKSYYLIYTLFTICSIAYQLAVAGFLYEFFTPVYLNTIFNYSIPLIALVLLGLFPISFFNIQKGEYKILIIVLKILILSLALSAILNLFYPFLDGILYSIKYTNIANILSMFVLLLISLKGYRDNKQGAVFYLMANTILFVSIVYFIFGLLGIIDNNDFYYYSLAIGSISQDIFLAFALVHATYLIKKDHEKNNQLLNEYSKLSFIGQTMLNISHQWKTPINSIFNNINHIEVARKFNDPNLDTIIDKSLVNIKQTTLFLKDTALGQLDFYKSKENVEKINLYQEISFLIKLIENEFSKKSIDVILNFDKNLEITIDKNSFLNVLMILFENSYKLFEQRKIQNPFIKLTISNDKNGFNLQFQDNAQGAKDDIDKIFDKSYSLNNSTGLGLYLAKEIVEYKLDGKINAQNIDNGISFLITI